MVALDDGSTAELLVDCLLVGASGSAESDAVVPVAVAEALAAEEHQL